MIYIKKSNRPDKKYKVIFEDGKEIHFGQKGYTDYILSGGDNERKERYLKRHAKNENWTKSGLDTAGWWSRYVLWNKPTLEKSIKDIEKRFGVKIKFL